MVQWGSNMYDANLQFHAGKDVARTFTTARQYLQKANLQLRTSHIMTAHNDRCLNARYATLSFDCTYEAIGKCDGMIIAYKLAIRSVNFTQQRSGGTCDIMTTMQDLECEASIAHINHYITTHNVYECLRQWQI